MQILGPRPVESETQVRGLGSQFENGCLMSLEPSRAEGTVNLGSPSMSGLRAGALINGGLDSCQRFLWIIRAPAGIRKHPTSVTHTCPPQHCSPSQLPLPMQKALILTNKKIIIINYFTTTGWIYLGTAEKL